MMQNQGELSGLIAAGKLLFNTKLELATAGTFIYQIVSHAEQYVNKRIKAYFSDDQELQGERCARLFWGEK